MSSYKLVMKTKAELDKESEIDADDAGGPAAVGPAARAGLAGRLLDAVDGDEAALDFGNLPGDEVTTAAFAAELTKLSVNKTLTYEGHTWHSYPQQKISPH